MERPDPPIWVEKDPIISTYCSWMRGFIDFFQLYDSTKVLLEDEKILNYLSLHKEGYKTILNIKWNFRERDESLRFWLPHMPFGKVFHTTSILKVPMIPGC
ncbi:hypothetical protein [Proteiniphilum sp. UBA5384]|uniref:hypothetical protein n=1 Tax=Proteiniphilum sp. UBA5384 TaxID=1947279 RepID=UPI0025D85524|nr:hypothetical protein [Proteiniphilum sp. UBA5384]